MLALYHNDMSSCAQKVRIVLSEKKLDWESRHLDLRSGEHQQPWYIKLNPRAVVPTLIDGDNVVPESNVINEYLDERFREVPLMPDDPMGRARLRIWTKQLDEDIHDACIAILSFGIAFRHQYIERGEQGRQMLERIPNIVKRERRRDVIDKGPDSMHFLVAVARMELLLTEMEAALARHPFLIGPDYTIADAAFTPYLARLDHLAILGLTDSRPHVADWYRRVKARKSFHDGIGKWENEGYLKLMKQRGAETWPKVKELAEGIRARGVVPV
jgi:glutathione S-transferase